MNQVNVLGTPYKIYIKPDKEDKMLETVDGYCDKTTKTIVVSDMKSGDLGNKYEHIKKTLRHEIIHAFMYESGLDGNINADTSGLHDEQYIDWFAWQFPKLQEAFKKANAI